MLSEIKGHLVDWPTQFLQKEDLESGLAMNTEALVPIDVFL